jgi:hypothetical protein
MKNCGTAFRVAEQKQRACMKNLMQALDLFGARSRNRTGTSFRTGDFKSHASTNFAIRAVARCSASNRRVLLNRSTQACVTGG